MHSYPRGQYAELTHGCSLRFSDVDECSDRLLRHRCDEASTVCNNTWGSYICSCKPGSSRINATHCKDTDECTTGRHTCDANAQCVSTIGSFNCRCKAGYRAAQNGGCEQINDCTTGNHDCHENADCFFTTLEGVKCFCKLGYIGNGTLCQDALLVHPVYPGHAVHNTQSCPRK